MSKVCLCQACLRVRPYSHARHWNEEVCGCGCEFCDCEDCQKTAALLKQGVRDGERLGTTVDIREWTEESGIGPSASETSA